MKLFLISIKGKLNILVKISDLQNFVSYKKPDFKKFQGWYSKPFFVYEILPFLPSYKVIVVCILDVGLKIFLKKLSTFTRIDTSVFTVNKLSCAGLIYIGNE